MNDRLFRNRARPSAAAARHSRHRARRPHRVAASGEPPMPDKPSLAVMPFQNMRHDPEQEYFADGMVEETITALSRIR